MRQVHQCRTWIKIRVLLAAGIFNKLNNVLDCVTLIRCIMKGFSDQLMSKSYLCSTRNIKSARLTWSSLNAVMFPKGLTLFFKDLLLQPPQVKLLILWAKTDYLIAEKPQKTAVDILVPCGINPVGDVNHVFHSTNDICTQDFWWFITSSDITFIHWEEKPWIHSFPDLFNRATISFPSG